MVIIIIIAKVSGFSILGNVLDSLCPVFPINKLTKVNSLVTEVTCLVRGLHQGIKLYLYDFKTYVFILLTSSLLCLRSPLHF